MTCPKCGNKNAECIIGSFWKCPGCDGARPVARREGPSLLEIISSTVGQLWPNLKVDDFASRWHGIPRVVGQFWGVDSNTQTAWWACELDGVRIARHRHNARAFTDFIGSSVSIFLSAVVLPDLAQRTIPCRGGRGVEVIGEFPHWVADDGQIMVRFADVSDAFELRMRAVWRPA